MAHYCKTSILAATVALFVFLAAAPQGSDAGILLSNLDLDLLSVEMGGFLYCSTSGNQIPGCIGDLCAPPLSGVPVSFSCDGGKTSLKQVVTGIDGNFNMELTTLEALVFNALNCKVYVDLVVVHCNLLPATGILEGPLKFLTLVDGIASFITEPFHLLTGAL